MLGNSHEQLTLLFQSFGVTGGGGGGQAGDADDAGSGGRWRQSGR